MREWIPVPGTAKGRLVETALREFALRGYEDVGVTEIAVAAGVTVGSLYHHFGSKFGLYELVRTDIERRLIDRMEGAWAAKPDLAGALGVGFDYVVRAGFTRLLAEAHAERDGDPVEEFLSVHANAGTFPVAKLLAAAWRTALELAEGDANAARGALLAISR